MTTPLTASGPGSAKPRTVSRLPTRRSKSRRDLPGGRRVFPGRRRRQGARTRSGTASFNSCVVPPTGWRRGRDSNPRSRASGTTVFKTVAFVHSATPPYYRILLVYTHFCPLYAECDFAVKSRMLCSWASPASACCERAFFVLACLLTSLCTLAVEKKARRLPWSG